MALPRDICGHNCVVEVRQQRDVHPKSLGDQIQNIVRSIWIDLQKPDISRKVHEFCNSSTMVRPGQPTRMGPKLLKICQILQFKGLFLEPF